MKSYVEFGKKKKLQNNSPYYRRLRERLKFRTDAAKIDGRLERNLWNSGLLASTVFWDCKDLLSIDEGAAGLGCLRKARRPWVTDFGKWSQKSIRGI